MLPSEHISTPLPGVKEAGVAGMPDEKSGEVVWAWVVRTDPALPKSPIGKTLRRKLKEEGA